jgi:hypothetical protein
MLIFLPRYILNCKEIKVSDLREDINRQAAPISKMNLEEIRNDARKLQPLNQHELNDKVLELKNKGVPFLGCVAFVQINQDLSLGDARKQTLALNAWTKEEKDQIVHYHKLMMSELDEENE